MLKYLRFIFMESRNAWELELAICGTLVDMTSMLMFPWGKITLPGFHMKLLRDWEVIMYQNTLSIVSEGLLQQILQTRVLLPYKCNSTLVGKVPVWPWNISRKVKFMSMIVGKNWPEEVMVPASL